MKANNPSDKSPAKFWGGHTVTGHMWFMSLLGLAVKAAVALGLLVYVPKLKGISNTLVLFAGFHVVGAFVLFSSGYVAVWPTLAGKFRAKNGARAQHLDFGWTPGMTLGPLVSAVMLLAMAVAVQVAWPAWWPAALVATLLVANYFAGYLRADAARKPDHVSLPMVDLLSSDHDLVLDAGCGAGRTTLALSRILHNGRIVALDRFDSGYIAGGGRDLLENNLRLAGLTDRVEIHHGDITDLPFGGATFDSAVSTHAMDHLGRQTERALREVLRVLKPGGRFLIVVWTPGWAMFSTANVLSFFLTTRAGWRRMAETGGFVVRNEGMFNGFAFLLLEKPSADARS
jgi:SAM-dependent methyltransferase